jgi:hypothetical protein
MRHLPPLSCTVVLVAALAGCQGGDSGKSSAEPKQSAHGVAQQLKDVELPDDAAALAALMRRQVQAAQSVRVSASTTSQGSSGKTGSLELTGALHKPPGRPAAATMKTVQTGGQDPGTTETVVSNGTVYLKVEGQEQAPGKPWLRISRQDLANTDLGPTKQGFEEAYNESLQAVQEASAENDVAALAHGKVAQRPVPETLDGVPVQRYVGTTATETLAAETNDDQLRQLAGSGVRSVPWTVWVDKKGLPRRFTMTMTIPDAGTITTKVTYSGWGEPLTITPPPAGQVAGLNG